MRFARTFVLTFVSVALAVPSLPQQTATSTTQSSPQALTLLQQSLAALTGGKSITDVTLSGTARLIVGPDDETGTGTLKALASGAGRMDLVLPSGPLSELANLTVAPPVGSWSGPDGISHPMAFHNLLSDPCWFFPAFAIARRLSNSSFVAANIGQETHESQTVQHISVSQTAPLANPPDRATHEHLTQLDFFLDSATLLPATITFNIHPDNNALLDIPVEIRFSDYRSVNGVQIPFHIQKFLNNSLNVHLVIPILHKPGRGLSRTTTTTAQEPMARCLPEI